MTDRELIEKMAFVWNDETDDETTESAMDLILRLVRDHDMRAQADMVAGALESARREAHEAGLREGFADGLRAAVDVCDAYWNEVDDAARQFAATELGERIGALRPKLDPAAPPTAPHPACAYCDKPATCHGSYEDGPPGFGCDEHCGHGCEDGHCDPVAPLAAPGEPAPLEAICVCDHVYGDHRGTDQCLYEHERGMRCGCEKFQPATAASEKGAK